MTKIGIIGFGNMGQAIYHVLEKAFGGSNLYVSDSHADKLVQVPKGHANTDPSAILDNVEVVILAVKPQSFADLAASLKMRLKGKKVLSIMSGVTLASIQSKTGAADVVRTTPNLPLKVGLALTAWIPSQSGTWALPILNAFGDELKVATEEQIDQISALSGVGPAYFFYLCEILATKAESFGFSPEQARKIAEATFVGSAELLWSDILSAQEWRHAVTSRGGLTAAAIGHLQTEQIDKAFHEAIDRAKQRAAELSV